MIYAGKNLCCGAHRLAADLRRGVAGGVLQAAPAPRLSNTPSAVPGPIPARGQHGADILRAAGLSETAIAGLLRS